MHETVRLCHYVRFASWKPETQDAHRVGILGFQQPTWNNFASSKYETTNILDVLTKCSYYHNQYFSAKNHLTALNWAAGHLSICSVFARNASLSPSAADRMTHVCACMVRCGSIKWSVPYEKPTSRQPAGSRSKCS